MLRVFDSVQRAGVVLEARTAFAEGGPLRKYGTSRQISLPGLQLHVAIENQCRLLQFEKHETTRIYSRLLYRLCWS